MKTLTFPPTNTFLLWGIGVTIHWSYLHGNYFGKLKRCDDSILRIESGDGLVLKSVTSADSETWDVRFRRVGSSDSVAEVNAVTREGYAVSPKYVIY